MLEEFDLADEVAAYIREKQRLVEQKTDPWVLFAEGRFQRAFSDYSTAVGFAISSGFTGRFLVRNLYAPPAQVPFALARRA